MDVPALCMRRTAKRYGYILLLQPCLSDLDEVAKKFLSCACMGDLVMVRIQKELRDVRLARLSGMTPLTKRAC